MIFRKQFITSIIFVSSLLAGLFITISIFSYGLNGKFYYKIYKVKVGMSEKEVIYKLGEPSKILIGGDHFINGYEKPNREVKFKALVYYGGIDRIAYIFIDETGKVEKVFIGGS